MTDKQPPDLMVFTAQIVSAYVGHNEMRSADVPQFIADVHDQLNRIIGGFPSEPRAELKPAIAIKKSVTPEFIICLEDGKKFKSLKRHLRSHYDLSPEQYREKWGLPHDYPMVAPNYAEARSQLAKKMGLGTRR